MSNYPVTKTKDAIREARELGIDVRTNASGELRFEAPGIPPKVLNHTRKTVGVDVERIFRKMREGRPTRRGRREGRRLTDEAALRALEGQAGEIGRLTAQLRVERQTQDDLVAELERLEAENLAQRMGVIDEGAHEELDALMGALCASLKLLGEYARGVELG